MAERVPYFAIPRYVEFRDDLPRNPVGRVLKYQLRDEGVDAGDLGPGGGRRRVRAAVGAGRARRSTTQGPGPPGAVRLRRDGRDADRSLVSDMPSGYWNAEGRRGPARPADAHAVAEVRESVRGRADPPRVPAGAEAAAGRRAGIDLARGAEGPTARAARDLSSSRWRWRSSPRRSRTRRPWRASRRHRSRPRCARTSPVTG